MIIVIIVSDDLQEVLIHKMNKADNLHFTYFNPVYGKGDGGMRFDKDYAPGKNTLFFVQADDQEKISALNSIIEDMRKIKKPKQGFHTIFINDKA